MPSKDFYIIGAGFSRMAGLPTAKDLVDSLTTDFASSNPAQAIGTELWREHIAMSDLSQACIAIAREIADGIGTLSLNWDLALELALNEIDCPWAYGISGALSILKPYGSINWTDWNARGMMPVLRGHDAFYSAAEPFERPATGHCVIDLQLESETAFSQRIWGLAADFSREADRVIHVGIDRNDYSDSCFERITGLGKGLRHSTEVA